MRTVQRSQLQRRLNLANVGPSSKLYKYFSFKFVVIALLLSTLLAIYIIVLVNGMHSYDTSLYLAEHK